MDDAREVVAKRLRKQARACGYLGSPLYEHILNEAAADALGAGPVLEVMGKHAYDPPGSAVALRLMGSVHRLVLQGHLPELAAFYPSTGGSSARPDAAWQAFRDALVSHRDEIAVLLERGVQTNEVGRCTALLGGFLEVAARTGLPLRVLEIGASAGLNLRWDRFSYAGPGGTWGDPGSPVRLTGFERAPDLAIEATVAERRGCDPAPNDPTTPEGRLTLESYVWPDQTERWENLEAALRVASRVPATVDRSGASKWLREMLRDPSPGLATVVYHSIVLQYMEDGEREEVLAQIQEVGDAASPEAPFAWLAMEPPAEQGSDDLAHIHLTLWPGGETKLVARAGYHGRPVIWLGF